MPLKKHKPEEIIGKLREAEIVLAHGGTTLEACRRIRCGESDLLPLAQRGALLNYGSTKRRPATTR